MKRIFLIVLDSFGIGEEPDASLFGDFNVNTLRSCTTSSFLNIPNLIDAGLGNAEGLECLPKTEHPTAAIGRLREKSKGKDTTIGHWEIAGVISKNALPTFPNGFPEEIINEFCEKTGRGILANKPYPGTEVINIFGDEHVRTGNLIVYTSADSVFQIAAHEDIVPLEELYEYCRIARKILQGKYGVGRVIARPFIGESGNYIRTSNRHDFSLEPPEITLLDAVKEAGLDSIAVGKIYDIFAGKGITQHMYNKSNEDGMDHTLNFAKQDFHGLCFVNLVDFDMLYGHRRDVDGYAKALSVFDRWLPKLLNELGEDDVVIITADHGCDPAYKATTDHTREYVPVIVFGKNVKEKNLGTRESFADIAATIADLLNIKYDTKGKSFANIICN